MVTIFSRRQVLQCLGALPWMVGVAGAGAATPPPLMLAREYRPGIALRDYWVSEKYDGVRAYWDGSALWLRSGHPLPAPPWFTQGWPGTPLDGELWAGRGAFDQVVGNLHRVSQAPDRWRGMRMMAFDLPAAPEPFDVRLVALRQLLREERPQLAFAPQWRVADDAALQALLRETVAAGGEGLVLRHGAGLYRALRSDDLLKLKPLQDAEAEVVSLVAGQGRHAGRMGALWVRTPEGIRFKLGTGFSDAQRADPPAPGTRVVYQFNGLTARGVPRFARFLRVREAMEG